MKLTVKTKVIGALAVILLIGILAMLFVLRELKVVERSVDKLAHVKEPLILAAYEMEINMNGIGLEVLKYLSTRNPRYRELVAKDIGDFAGFHATYRKLIASDRERALDAEITRLYGEFETLGNALMQGADEQEETFEKVAVGIEEIDDILDKQLQPDIEGVPDLTRSNFNKAIALANMEAEVAEIGFWTANYQRLQDPAFEREIEDKFAYFADALADFESYDLTDKEQRLAARLRNIFETSKNEVREVIALEDALNQQRERFIALRVSMDDMLDDEIQPLVRQHLEVPEREAEAATGRAVGAMRLLIPLYVVCALVIALFLIRSIIGPLSKLKVGTTAITAGDLQHRIDVRGADEFSELAGLFNTMVAELQASTVSRVALEESERKLRATVTDLRHEIVEREHAQAEQVKLQAALRRSETMSAMGALVAGVAHEVRNPLFGISSNMDAMDARFAGREEHQRYSKALRVEVNRLGKLMADLLEYGKPSAAEKLPASLSELITEAVALCTPSAERAKVALVSRIQSDIPFCCMDRSRLLQVFRNLLENAIQHAPEHSDVCISAEPTDDDRIACSIADSGPGFATEDIERIFDPFSLAAGEARAWVCLSSCASLTITVALRAPTTGNRAGR